MTGSLFTPTAPAFVPASIDNDNMAATVTQCGIQTRFVRASRNEWDYYDCRAADGRKVRGQSKADAIEAATELLDELTASLGEPKPFTMGRV